MDSSAGPSAGRRFAQSHGWPPECPPCSFGCWLGGRFLPGATASAGRAVPPPLDPSAAETSTFAPSRKRSAPSTTTRSPGERPALTVDLGPLDGAMFAVNAGLSPGD